LVKTKEKGVQEFGEFKNMVGEQAEPVNVNGKR